MIGVDLGRGIDQRPSRAKLTPTESTKISSLLVRGPAAAEMSKASQLTTAPLLLRSKAAREKDPGKKNDLRDEAVIAQAKADAQLPGLYREVVDRHADADAARLTARWTRTRDYAGAPANSPRCAAVTCKRYNLA